MAIGIHHDSAVVIGAVFRSVGGLACRTGTMGKRCLVGRVGGRAAGCCKGYMYTGSARRFASCNRIEPERPVTARAVRSLCRVVMLASEAERREGGVEEGQRLAKIAHTEREVIEHRVTLGSKIGRED